MSTACKSTELSPVSTSLPLPPSYILLSFEAIDFTRSLGLMKLNTCFDFFR